MARVFDVCRSRQVTHTYTSLVQTGLDLYVCNITSMLCGYGWIFGICKRSYSSFAPLFKCNILIKTSTDGSIHKLEMSVDGSFFYISRHPNPQKPSPAHAVCHCIATVWCFHFSFSYTTLVLITLLSWPQKYPPICTTSPTQYTIHTTAKIGVLSTYTRIK